MNTRKISAIFIVALVVSGLSTLVLSHKMRAHAAEKTPVQLYVAAAKSLQAGEVLKAESLEMLSWPASNPVAGAFVKADELIGRSVLYPVEKDQPLTAKFLSTPGSGVGLAGEIPSGMRAIALRCDEVMGVAGFVFPGSHVDVLVTYRMDKSPEPITLTVLQDAQVLAAGQKNQPDPEGKPVTATVVTLLLTPDDAQRAVLASTQGAIHFILRNGSDKAHPQESPLALSRLSGMTQDHPDAASPTGHSYMRHIEAPHTTIVVQTIAGDKQSSETFSGAK